jgi:hypothetical protein
LLKDIKRTLGTKFDSKRFVPYVQMYEFEALLFSKPQVIADVVQNPGIGPELAAIRGDFRTPEEINDDSTTAPSKRVEKLHPAYEKPLHGSIAAERIGIDTMLDECPHFQAWLARLRGSVAGAK